MTNILIPKAFARWNISKNGLAAKGKAITQEVNLAEKPKTLAKKRETLVEKVKVPAEKIKPLPKSLKHLPKR